MVEDVDETSTGGLTATASEGCAGAAMRSSRCPLTVLTFAVGASNSAGGGDADA